MVVDDCHHVAVEHNRLTAEPTTHRIRQGQSDHQPSHRRRRYQIESRIAELDVAARGRDGHSAGELDHVDAAVVVDLEQHVVGLHGRVVDDDGAVPRPPDEVPAGFEFDLPPGVGAGSHSDPHARMRVATALTTESAVHGESSREAAGDGAD
ncbi:MAG TPA: hypothetical protein VE487_13125 [Ilumatobacter sp.]|nr:hypothetical protein [Ilumatobacter sp.]